MNPHVFPTSPHLFNRERGPVIFPALAEEAVSCLLLKSPSLVPFKGKWWIPGCVLGWGCPLRAQRCVFSQWINEINSLFLPFVPPLIMDVCSQGALGTWCSGAALQRGVFPDLPWNSWGRRAQGMQQYRLLLYHHPVGTQISLQCWENVLPFPNMQPLVWIHDGKTGNRGHGAFPQHRERGRCTSAVLELCQLPGKVMGAIARA